MPSGDVTFTSSALALFSMLLGSVVSALVFLFFLAWRERDRSAREVKEQYDARAADLRAENARLVSVTAQADRDAQVVLGLIRDSVVSVAGTMTAMHRTVEAQQQTMASMQQTMASMQRIVEAQQPPPGPRR